MPLMSPTLSRETYAATLACLYPLLSGWEDWSAGHAPADLRALVAGRKRAPLLERDLVRLGMSLPEVKPFGSAAIPGLAAADRAAFLGAMYVMEGSTLGGLYIARHVEPLLGLSAECGTAYFRGYGEQTGEQWRSFQALLTAIPDIQTEIAVAAARAMFQVFEAAILPLTSHADA